MHYSNVFLLYGPDKYIINEKIKRLLQDIKDSLKEEPEIVIINDDQTDINYLRDNLINSSLFSLSKVVIIKDPFWLKKSGRKLSKINEVLELFKYYFSKEYPRHFLIVTNDNLYKDNQIIKLFTKYAQIMQCKPLSREELRNWVSKRFKDKKLKANADVINLIADSGQDMYYMENLIEKLSLEDIETVTKSFLEDQLESNHEIKIFKLTDALFSRNLDLSLLSFHQLVNQGGNASYFINMITKQFIIFSKVKSLFERGYTNQQIEQTFGLQSFVVKNMLKNIGKYSWPELWNVFTLLLETDIKIKSTSQDKNILIQSLIISICNK